MLLKLRDLSRHGVIADLDGFDLPQGAFSFAKNLRFRNGRVYRGPVWRLADTLGTDPRAVFDFSVNAGSISILIGYLNGRVKLWTSSAETDYSITGYVNASSDTPWTSCALGQVLYVNRVDRVPWSLSSAASRFVTLANWDTNWRTKVLRSYNGALCAFNIVDSGNNRPTTIRTSEIIAESGEVPSTWDYTDPTNNATENVLSEMSGEITDAQQLGDTMYVFGLNETWAMRADGSDDVYDYRKTGFGKGALSTNCVVTVGSAQYVFGPDDFWVHDGTQSFSIADDKVRKFVFSTINRVYSSRCFVNYNPALNEIKFFYVSGDEYLAFGEVTKCNRCAVFDLTSKTWTFDDAPGLVHAAVGNVSAISTWANIGSTWETVGSSWLEQEDGLKTVNIYVGCSSSAHSLSDALYANDTYGIGSIVSLPVEEAANPEAYIERTWIDLDEIDADLRGYKHITSIYPQGRIDPDGASWEFSFGVTDYSGQQPTYEDYQTYDGDENYKVDFTYGGRFLHLRGKYDDYKTASLSGLDIEVEVTGDT